jgi:hypothetical protein
MFAMMIEPLAMKYPSCTSSCSTQCGAPSGVVGPHRMTSLSIAERYGSWLRSANVGRRSLPTTASSSAWHLRCASGYAVIARRKDDMAETGYRAGMRHALSVLIPVAYGVCATRIEAGRSPLDLVLFFWRHFATFE